MRADGFDADATYDFALPGDGPDTVYVYKGLITHPGLRALAPGYGQMVRRAPGQDPHALHWTVTAAHDASWCYVPVRRQDLAVSPQTGRR